MWQYILGMMGTVTIVFFSKAKYFENWLRYDAVIVARGWHIFGTECIFHVDKLVV